MELPAVEAGEHLVEYLFKVGPGIDGKPVSFAEIAAWTDLTGVVLTSWEATTLRELSVAYMAEYGAADDPKRPPPYLSIDHIDREAVSQGRSELFARLEAQDERRD